jgi:hypothetical protein
LIHIVLHFVLFFLGLGMIKIFRPRRQSETATIAWAYIAAYLARTATILLLHAFSHDGTLMLDDRGYDEQGHYLAHLFPWLSTTNLADQLGTKHVAYPVIVGFVYFIGGHSILSAKLLNAFFGALLSPVIYWLASELGSDDLGLPRRAAWMAALFPFDIAWSGLLLRDTILEFLFTFLLAATVATVRRRSYRFCGVVLVTLYVMNYFRFYAVFVWTGAIVLAAIAELARSRIGRQDLKRAWIGFFSLTAAGAVTLNLSLLWLVQQFDFVKSLALQVLGLGEGGDARPLSFALSLGFAASFARAVFVYIFGPFPWVFWGIDEPVNFIFYPGMYVIFALFPFFAVGFWSTVRNLEPMKIFLISCFVLHGLIEIYVFQGAPRQRMMTDAVFILCAALAWPMRHNFARTIRFTYAALILIAVGHTILRNFG